MAKTRTFWRLKAYLSVGTWDIGLVQLICTFICFWLYSSPVPALQSWIEERAVIQDLLQQHLHRVQQHMKTRADKRRSPRTFSVGDQSLPQTPTLRTNISGQEGKPQAILQILWAFLGNGMHWRGGVSRPTSIGQPSPPGVSRLPAASCSTSRHRCGICPSGATIGACSARLFGARAHSSGRHQGPDTAFASVGEVVFSTGGAAS